MDPAQMGLMIPIAALCIPLSAIVGGCGIGFFKSWSKHQQEMAAIRSTRPANVDNAALESLREEVMRLRDTTTQYDMSVEKSLTELRQRMGHIESRLEITPISTAEPTPSPVPPRSASAAYTPPATAEQQTQSVTPAAS